MYLQVHSFLKGISEEASEAFSSLLSRRERCYEVLESLASA
jgi:hypothetical protein